MPREKNGADIDGGGDDDDGADDDGGWWCLDVHIYKKCSQQHVRSVQLNARNRSTNQFFKLPKLIKFHRNVSPFAQSPFSVPRSHPILFHCFACCLCPTQTKGREIKWIYKQWGWEADWVRSSDWNRKRWQHTANDHTWSRNTRRTNRSG